ncbi:MAG: UDP-N-acetylmuramate dehydrogenase [Acidimicrobiia bacterium]|nr:UDP-N-acetylmuramate dehydrogenase [Acidimicrobiia bacterium]
MTLARLVTEGRVQAGVDLSGLTTYRLGGPAAFLLDAATSDDLIAVAAVLAEETREVLVLGRGSNLVISEAGFDGLAIRLGPEFGGIELDAGARVTVGGIVPLPQVARTATAAGRRGLEFLIGVPGSAGGGVRQNAGCFGTEMVDVLESAVVFDLLTGKTAAVDAFALDMTYRHTSVTATDVVLSATFQAGEGDPAPGLELIREHTRWRRLYQPGGTLNAGSVFKNPPGDSAGRIIDSLGLKGLRIGGAEVSAKHANFFVAMPGTEPSHVYLLVKKVAAIVGSETGIQLEPEIQFVGHFENAEK